MRWLVIALVACSSKKEPPKPAPSPRPIDAAVVHHAPPPLRVDKRVELVSTVFRLAGAGGYDAKSSYALEIDRTFAPFKDHPAVQAAAAMRIGFDAPMILAVHLDDHINAMNPGELGRLDARLAGVDLDAFAKQLRDFETASKFDDFFVAHQRAFDAAAEPLAMILSNEDLVGFFDEMFGPRPKATYSVVRAMLSGTHNFGVRNGDDTYQILGDAASLPLLVHEMAHSYINPLFEQHAADLEPAGKALYPLFEPAMRAQQYTTWQIMMNESGVRAVTVLYMIERKGAVAGAAAARDEMRAGFVWINELVDVFRKAKRDKSELVPAVAKLFDDLVKRYNGKPPPMPFIGPVDGIWRTDRVLALPKLPALVAYIDRLAFFKDVPRSQDEPPGKGIIAYGSPSTNPAVAKAAEWGLWKITPDGIELGAKKVTGKHLVLIACWFRRDDPPHGIVVYAAADEADLVGINNLHHGEHDWLVAKKTAKGYDVVDQGDWLFENGAWVPFHE